MQEVFKRIIEKLENEYDNLKATYKRTKDLSFYFAYQGVNKAIGIVEHEAAENNNDWIPCDVRLPDYKDTKDPFTKAHTYLTDYVNVTVKRSKDGKDDYYVDTAIMIGRSPDEMRWLLRDGLDNHMVVAWRPTPEPYHPRYAKRRGIT